MSHNKQKKHIKIEVSRSPWKDLRGRFCHQKQVGICPLFNQKTADDKTKYHERKKGNMTALVLVVGD